MAVDEGKTSLVYREQYGLRCRQLYQQYLVGLVDSDRDKITTDVGVNVGVS